MSNLLCKYLEEKSIKPATFARMIKANPAGVARWIKGMGSPGPSNAWKIHKLTQGAVPISYWGFAIINGKMRKMDKVGIFKDYGKENSCLHA